VSLSGKLTAAAASIALMADDEITQRLDQLETAHRGRSALERARHRAELDSLDLDWAAYQLASRYDDADELTAAAHWYRTAAANDFADAALRLGTVLDVLASRCASVTGSEPSRYTCEREELALVSDAARWYAEAYAAGHPEAAGRLDGMISRHDTRCPRAAVPAKPAEPGEQRCERGGLSAVVSDCDLTAAAAHFLHCTPCQNEFLRLGGLLPRAHTRTAPDDACDQGGLSSHAFLFSERAGPVCPSR
jgi:hypothetical protein